MGVDACREAIKGQGDGRVSVEDAKKAKTDGKSYYETLDGEKLDRGIIDACRDAVAGQGDGRVSVDDARKVFEKAADAGKITTCERWSLRFCLAEFTWTEAAQDWFIEEVKKFESKV